jgi:hypothetical protein
LIGNDFPFIAGRDRQAFFGEKEVRTDFLEKISLLLQIVAFGQIGGAVAIIYELECRFEP